ncbi:MAG TPA: hypothetical protein DEB06_08200 [Phycisphaerales bacterium]|nr:hypothetical protein [Phycisphaerales bacterium]
MLLVSGLDRWVFQNLVPSLRRVCGRVYCYPLGDSMGNWRIRSWPAVRERLMSRFLSDVRGLVKGPGLDLVLTVLYDDTLRPRDVRALRDMGVRVATYHVDMNMQWYRVLRHAPALDVLAVSHMQNLEPLARRGVQMHFMPMGASPDRYDRDPVPDAPETGVLMLGSANRHRVRAVAACREVTEDVDVFGPGWPGLLSPDAKSDSAESNGIAQPLVKRLFDFRHYLVPRVMAEGSDLLARFVDRARPLDEGTLRLASSARVHGHAPEGLVGSLLARSRIALGVNQRTREIGDRRGVADSRLRDFEAPMSGAFYLVQSFVDLPVFYRTGSEVEAWSTLEELKEKVRYFLDHDEERASIARAGRARARKDHSWDARLGDLLHRLGLSARRGDAPCPMEVVANLSSRPWCVDSPGCRPEGGGPGPAPELESLARSG